MQWRRHSDCQQRQLDGFTQQQEIIDTAIAPSNDLESAILATLDPGLYTAILRGVSDTTGIGLVEAYDIESTG